MGLKHFSIYDFSFKDTKEFSEDNAPKWLCEGGVKGSTMDNRWFWTGHVLTLKVGEHIDTDFNRITRLS